MGTGAFLTGLAGGIDSGIGIKERKKDREREDKWLEIAKLNAERGVLDHESERAYRSQPDGGGGSGGSGGSGGGGAGMVYSGRNGASARDMRGGDRELLAKTLMAEAGGEGYEGMLAAGAVIHNRANTKGYGDSLRDVIMKPGQFSAWNGVTGYAGGEGGLDMDKINPSEHALKAADAILSGSFEDPTGGATHYYNPSVANPKWGQKRAGGDWLTIGNHIFGSADAGRSGARSKPRKAAPAPQSTERPQARPVEPTERPQARPMAEAAPSPAPAERGILSTGELLARRYTV
jgi:hypothetical protein